MNTSWMMKTMKMMLLTRTISSIPARRRGVNVEQLVYFPNGDLRESQKVNIAHLIFRCKNGGGRDGRVGWELRKTCN